MAAYSYAIATEAGGVGGLTNVEELSTGFPPPEGGVLQYPEVYIDGDGQRQYDGFPSVTWRWTGGLTQAQYNTLRGYCAAGSASKTVYITTKKDDGTYANYKAILHWPDEPDRFKVSGGGGFYAGFELLFTRLEAQ